MSTCMKVTGYSVDRPGLWGDSHRHEYECFVRFNSYRDHLPMIKDYLKWYCDCDVEGMGSGQWQVLDNYNCAIAMITFALRDQMRRFDYTSHDYVSERSLPDAPPTKSEDGYSVWIIETDSKEINTPKSAAWKLYRICQTTKISVSDAMAIVRDEFPNELFYWHDVLSEFSKMGGRYTSKYLRIDHR